MFFTLLGIEGDGVHTVESEKVIVVGLLGELLGVDDCLLEGFAVRGGHCECGFEGRLVV